MAAGAGATLASVGVGTCLDPASPSGDRTYQAAAPRRCFRLSTVRWLVGLLCTLVGAQMLVVPHLLTTQPYDPVRPLLGWWGTGMLLSGLLLVVVAAAGGTRPLRVAAHLACGLMLALLAVAYAAAGGIVAPVVHGALSAAILLALVAPACRPNAPGAPDLFSWMLGGVLGALGVLIMAWPDVFAGTRFAWLLDAPLAYGLCVLLGGGLLVAANHAARVPAWGRAAPALLLGILFVPGLVRAALAPAWLDVSILGVVAAGLLTAPWLGPFLERIDPRSLRTRLAVMLGVSSGLALILVVMADANREERSLRALASTNQQALAVALSHDVADYVELHEAAVRALAARPDLLLRPRADQEGWLRAHGGAHTNAIFSILDAEGRQVARSDGRPLMDASTASWLASLRQTPRAVRIVTRSTTRGRPVFGYVAPVIDGGGTLTGFVSATVESSHVAERLQRVVAEPDRRAYLVEGGGRTIAHPELALVENFEDLSAVPPVAALLAAGDAAGSLVYGTGAQEWLAGYARVPGLGWGVVVEQPTSVALASVRAGRERAFLALLAVAGIATAVGALAAGWLTAPLASLAAAVRRLTEGESDARLPVPAITTSTVTEIAQLAAAFGEMRERLAARTLVLERSEAALRESEQRFRTMANSAPVLIWMAGPDGRCDFFNDGWLRFTGRPLEQELGDGWAEGVHPDDLERCLGIYRANLVARRSFSMEYRLRRADGAYRWIVDDGAPRFEPDGSFAGFIGSCIDITERRSAEEASRLSEERLRLALQAGRMGTWDWDLQTNAVTWDGSLEELHGLPRGGFDGRFETYVGLVHPDDRAGMLSAIRASLDHGSQYSTEFRVVWPDGSVHWIGGLGRAYPDERGLPSRMVGIGLEVTDLRRSMDVQRLLAEAGSRLVSSLDYETTLRSIAQLVATTMADYCIVQVQGEDGGLNVEVAHVDPARAEAARRIVAQRAASAATAAREVGADGAPCGGGATNGVGGDAARDADPGAGQAIAPAPWSDRPQLWPTAARPTGGPREADRAACDAAEATPAAGAIGELAQALGAGSAISVPLLARERTIGSLTLIAAESGRRYGEPDLAVAEALAARAALAVDNARLYGAAQAAIRARDEFLSIASHELRTPVTGIKGYAQLLLRAVERDRLEGVRLLRSLRAIDEATDRLTVLTQDLLDVSRIRLGELPLHLRPVDIVDLVQRVSERLGDHLSARHALVVDVRSPLPLISADADRLEQVITNLLDNAIKYSPAGGAVRVGLGLAGDGVELTVEDDGIGLPAGAAEAIFQPFGRAPNATERHLPGMGLGLYICRNIVERHGGWIAAESRGEDRGTTFRMVLPFGAGAIEAAEPTAPPALSV